jgi:hypothetical protein
MRKINEMISDSDLETIGERIEAEFPGVRAHYRRESHHDFIRGIGLEIGDRRHAFIVHPETSERDLMSKLRNWCSVYGVPNSAKTSQDHEAKP